MDKYTVLGFREVDFKDKNTGNSVSGISLYLSTTAEGVQGLMTEKMFCGRKCLDDSAYDPTVGDDIWISYNKYGKPANISLA